MEKLIVSALQMTSGEDKEKNLLQAERLIKKAIQKKARFIVLPEVFNYRGNLNEAYKFAEPIPGYSTDFIANIAKKNKVYILIGSMMEKTSSKPFNTSILINSSGKIISTYRKIHLFDIKLKGKEILESSRNKAGNEIKLTKIFGIKTGLSICYDLRFPEMFRKYSESGAEIICVPSSFTKITGEAHWEALLRARAIENQCYVIAPNQAGIGSGGVKTYGHSLIIDPWGKILACAPDYGEAVITAELNFKYLKNVRKNLPALEHRKIK